MREYEKFKSGESDVAYYLEPFTYSIRHRAFQIVCLLISAYNIYYSIISALSANVYGTKRFLAMRLEKRDIFDPSLVSRISLINNGCEIVNIQGNATKAIAFENIVTMNGFSLYLANQSRMSTPVRFDLLATNDNWQTDFVIGSSDMRWADTDVRFLDHTALVSGSLSMDYRPRWEWYLGYIVLRLVVGFACFFSAVTGFLAFPALSKSALVYLCALMGSVGVIIALGYFCDGIKREAFSPLIDGFLYSSVAAVFFLFESFLPHACLVLGLASFSTKVVSNCVVFQDCPYLLVEPPLGPACILAWGAYLLALRRRRLRKTLLDAAAQARALDAAWRRARDSDEGSLSALEALTRATAAACAHSRVRHVARSPAPV